MRILMFAVLLAAGPALFAQDAPAPAPAPQAAAPQAPPAREKGENAPRPIPAKIIAGTVASVDLGKKSITLIRTDEEGKGETLVFWYDAKARFYQRNKPMTLEDLVPGIAVKVHYSENRDGSFQVKRVMIEAPKAAPVQADAPAQSGGTGN
jgi:hypothetical protein